MMVPRVLSGKEARVGEENWARRWSTAVPALDVRGEAVVGETVVGGGSVEKNTKKHLMSFENH